MPHRCTNCQHLSRTDDNPECKTRKICNFQRVEVIHFLHPDGTGRVHSAGTKQVVNEGKEFTVKADLKLCCPSTVQFAHCTPAFHAVTCMDCIENFKALKPELFKTEPTVE